MWSLGIFHNVRKEIGGAEREQQKLGLQEGSRRVCIYVYINIHICVCIYTYVCIALCVFFFHVKKKKDRWIYVKLGFYVMWWERKECVSLIASISFSVAVRQCHQTRMRDCREHVGYFR